jgi:hypothetical protein
MGAKTDVLHLWREQACEKKAVEYWVYQVKLGRTAMEDELKGECSHASAMSHS